MFAILDFYLHGECMTRNRHMECTFSWVKRISFATFCLWITQCNEAEQTWKTILVHFQICSCKRTSGYCYPQIKVSNKYFGSAHLTFLLFLTINHMKTFIWCNTHLYTIFLSCLFFWPHPRHMEVTRLGVESELQLSTYATDTAMPDLNHICDLHHSSWQHRMLNHLSEPRGANPHPQGH